MQGSLPEAVCGLLLERGVFSATDVLRAMGLTDAQWAGALPAMEVAFDDPAAVRTALRKTEALCMDLGLEAERGVSAASPASSDAELDGMLRSVWRPAGDARQLDLFRDSGRALAFNDLGDALQARDGVRATRERERLAALAPDHPGVAQAATLIAALEAPPPDGAEQAIERLGRLERDWRRAASALLGARGRDFLAPWWQEVGQALDGVTFDPAHPNRHASWAWRQCRDWNAVLSSVRAVPHHANHPVLLARLAEAHHALHERTVAVEHWFALCRLAPEEFARRVRAPDFPDRPMAEAWHEAADSEVLEEDLTPAWFPAWMLIAEPGLARALPAIAEADAPALAFNLVRALRLADRVGLRRELKIVHPGLLAGYLASLP